MKYINFATFYYINYVVVKIERFINGCWVHFFMLEKSLFRIVTELERELAEKSFGYKEKVMNAGSNRAWQKSKLEYIGTFDRQLRMNFSITEIPVEDIREDNNFLRKLVIDAKSTLEKRTNYENVAAELKEKKKKQDMLDRNKLDIIKFFDFLAAAGTFSVAAFAGLKDDWPTAIPMLSSAYYFALDISRNKSGNFFSRERLTGVLYGLLPSVIFGAHYLVSDDLAYLKKAKTYELAPETMFFLGCFTSWASYKRHSLKNYYQHLERWVTDFKMPKEFKPQFKKLERLLDEIGLLQNSNASKASPSEFEGFEEVCISYLQNGATINDVRTKRDELKEKYSVRQQPTTEQKTKSVVIPTAPKESEYDKKVYDFVSQFGADDSLASRIARGVPMEEISDTITKLRGAAGENYKSILEANPGLLLQNRQAKDIYLGFLYETAGKISHRFNEHIPPNYQIARNPVAFSTAEGLMYLLSTLEGKISASHTTADEEWEIKLAKDGYNNFNLLNAILLDGFRLSTPRPKIGMRYTDYVRIKRETGKNPKVTSIGMEEYNKVFRKLTSDHVILTDKEAKSGGGKFGGCHSVTPHVQEIKKPNIRHYVAHLLYEK